MDHREHYEEGISVRRAGVLLTLIGLFMLFLLAGDWFMRFYWFRWHDTIYIRPLFTADQPGVAATPTFSTLTLGEGRGGDLSRLIGVPAARAKFEEYRPEDVVTIDPHGFRSAPYEQNQKFDYIVVGDSYMAEGVPITNQISARLSELLGQPVLNRAYMGRGPFQSLMLWLEQNQHAEQLPKWLIWGFVERDISGSAFAGYVYLLDRHIQMGEVKQEKEATSPRVFLWSRLQPSELRRSLPNSSALAQISRKIWTYASYYVFRELPPDVFAFDSQADQDEPMLGYSISLESMYWTSEQRDLDKVVWAIDYIRDYLAGLGIKLLVVPIPDKEQVYRDLIPPAVWPGAVEPPESVLYELIQRLKEKEIPSVSLLPVYREEAAKSVPLYWHDDTHWRPEGIRAAAELITSELDGIVK